MANEPPVCTESGREPTRPATAPLNRAVGSRIGAIFGGDPQTKVLQVLGAGVRAPDEVPNAAAGGFLAEMLREAQVPNPCLVLDNGDQVYGCECWWGSEAVVHERIAQYERDGYTVVVVRIADMRVAAQKGVQ